VPLVPPSRIWMLPPLAPDATRAWNDVAPAPKSTDFTLMESPFEM